MARQCRAAVTSATVGASVWPRLAGMTRSVVPPAGHIPSPSTTPVVFVALGTRMPPTLIEAVRQAHRQLPNSPVHVLIDNAATARRVVHRLPRPIRAAVTVTDIAELPMTENWAAFSGTTEQDTSFRAGFWRLTAQRLFALERFLAATPDSDLIHPENDYLLLTEEADLLGLQQSVTGVALPVGDPDHVYAALLYVRRLPSLTSALRVLLTVLAEQPRDNEMRLLARAMARSDLYCPLPTLPSGADRLCHAALQPGTADTLPADVQWRNFPQFGVLFDAITLGQYLSGIDPANYAFIRRPGFANQSSWVNPVGQQWQLTSEAGRWRLLVETDAGWVRVVGLHLHGKDLHALDDRGARWLRRRLQQTQRIGAVTELRRRDAFRVDVAYLLRYGAVNPQELRMAAITAGSLMLRGRVPLPQRSRRT